MVRPFTLFTFRLPPPLPHITHKPKQPFYIPNNPAQSLFPVFPAMLLSHLYFHFFFSYSFFSTRLPPFFSYPHFPFSAPLPPFAFLFLHSFFPLCCLFSDVSLHFPFLLFLLSYPLRFLPSPFTYIPFRPLISPLLSSPLVPILTFLMRIPVWLTFRLSAVYSICFAVTILSHVNERVGDTYSPPALHK